MLAMTTQGDSSSSIHDGFMLSEQQEVRAEERGEAVPMAGMNSSNPRASGVTGYGRLGSTTGHTSSWRTSEENDEDDDEVDVNENSELHRHARSEMNTPNNGIDRNGDGGESGLDQEDEKSFKYYKELPDHTKLYNAKKRAPGLRAIGAGLAALAALGYLIAYLCTSVRTWT